MKIFKSIRQLHDEKKKIKQYQHNLEATINNNWNELKESLRPKNIAQQSLNKAIKINTIENEDSVLKSTAVYAASLLAKNFVEKTSKKFNRLFKK